MEKRFMTNNPLVLLMLGGLSFYVGKLWLDDLRAARAGRPNPRALPGAVPVAVGPVLIAVAGAVVLLGIETAGEQRLGIASEQSTITWLFAAYTILASPMVEELIFRGFLVVNNRGATVRWAAVVGASALFALLHPFLWEWDDHFTLTLTVKGGFSTAVVFATSVWLYVARLARWNPLQSLIPCVAAHAAKNAGVVLIKWHQGFVDGWW